MYPVSGNVSIADSTKHLQRYTERFVADHPDATYDEAIAALWPLDADRGWLMPKDPPRRFKRFAGDYFCLWYKSGALQPGHHSDTCLGNDLDAALGITPSSELHKDAKGVIKSATSPDSCRWKPEQPAWTVLRLPQHVIGVHHDLQFNVVVSDDHDTDFAGVTQRLNELAEKPRSVERTPIILDHLDDLISITGGSSYAKPYRILRDVTALRRLLVLRT